MKKYTITLILLSLLTISGFAKEEITKNDNQTFLEKLTIPQLKEVKKSHIWCNSFHMAYYVNNNGHHSSYTPVYKRATEVATCKDLNIAE